tara:strand:- start:939 stop:1376 length:438 start_codon:yes stop_codon:yes gene_type:complete
MAKISTLTELTTLTDDCEIVINDSTPDTKKITVENLKAGLGVNYKEIVLLVSQSGTDAPTVTEVFNNSGATITPSRLAEGVYLLSLSTTILDATKTIILANNVRFPYFIQATRNGGNSVLIGTYTTTTTSDTVLSNDSIIIRIYE